MGTNMDWTGCKRKRKGPKGPDDYLSPKKMQKILNRESDTKGDAEWIKCTLSTIKSGDRSDGKCWKCYCSNKIVCPKHKEKS